MGAMAAESSEMSSKNEEKKGISGEQIYELQAYLSKLRVANDDIGNKAINQALATQKEKVIP